MILQLNPPLEVTTPHGLCHAEFIIDYGLESDLYFVCILNDTGEIWTFSNKEIRATKNITAGRK